DTEEAGIAARVRAVRARIRLGQVAALRARTDALCNRFERAYQTPDLVRRTLEKVIGQPECGLATDARQASELAGKVVNCRQPVPPPCPRRPSRQVRQLERQRNAARQLPQFLFVDLLRALLRLRDRGQDQVLEHLDVVRIDDRRVDSNLVDQATAVNG